MKKLLTLSFLFLSIITINNIYGQWSSVGTNGFGDATNNKSISCLKSFNGYLYAGTGGYTSTNSAKVFRSQAGNPGVWTEVLNAGNNNCMFTTMLVHNNQLYVSGKTQSPNGKVYKSSTGTNFKSFFDADVEVTQLFAFKGTGNADSIFVCRYNGTGEIYKSDPNNTDSLNATGSWRMTQSFANEAIVSHTILNNVLYIGTSGGSTSGPAIYKSIDGITFTLLAYANSDLPGGQGWYQSISTLANNGDTLYAATKGDQIVTTDYWYSADDGLTWWPIAGHQNYDETTFMTYYNNELWFTLASRYSGGPDNIAIHRGYIGQNLSYKGNFGSTNNYGVNGCLEFFDSYVYYGSENLSTGGQLHRRSLCKATASTNSNPPYCKNSTISLQGNASNGLAPYDYSWINVENVDTIFYNQTPIDTLTATPVMTYYLKVEDANGCIAWDTLIINVTNSKDILGKATYSIGPVTKGMAVLFDTLTMTAKDSSALTAVGNYIFSNVDAGDYRILIVPDTMYKKLIATYYDSVPLWDSAWVINHGCTANQTIDIKMFEMPILGNGLKASISGRIVEDQGFRAGANRAPGEPISGVSVKVGRKPPGGTNIISTDSTDSNGVYNIDSLLVDTVSLYTVYVDIPGYYRDSTYKFKLTAVSMYSPKLDSLNYRVDSIMIRKDTTSWLNIAVNDIEKYNLHNITVSPNPVQNNANISYSIDKQTKVVVSIYDIRGVKMQELINNEQPAGEHMINFNNDNKLPPGNYFVSLFADGNISVAKMIIIE